MKALRIISDVHQALAGILHAVRVMLKEIARGGCTDQAAARGLSRADDGQI